MTGLGDRTVLVPTGNRGEYAAYGPGTPREGGQCLLVPTGNRGEYYAVSPGVPTEGGECVLIPIGGQPVYAITGGAPLVPECCALINGGFETGDMTGWELVYQSHDAGSDEVNAAAKYSGDYGLQINLVRVGPPGYMPERVYQASLVNPSSCRWAEGDTLTYRIRTLEFPHYTLVMSAIVWWNGAAWVGEASAPYIERIYGTYDLKTWVLPAMQHLGAPHAIQIDVWLDDAYPWPATGTVYLDDVSINCG